MLSLSKIFWLFVILLSIWYIFKIIEKKQMNSKIKSKKEKNFNKKGIDAFKCEYCGLWSTGDRCNNKECSKT